MSSCRRRVLIIYHEPPHARRVTVRQHYRALEDCCDRYEISYYNAYDAVPDWSILDDSRWSVPMELAGITFAAVILHYTFLGHRSLGLPFYHWKRKFDWIADLTCLKIAIPQDEGDYAGVLDDWLLQLGVTVVFSVHFSEAGPLYPGMRNHATFYPCLPGYVDEKAANEYAGRLLPIASRKKTLVYRARRLPHCYGTAGRLKYEIGDVMAESVAAMGIKVDISTRDEDAIYGNAWFDFLASSKAVIGTQGGFSVIDWRGEVKEKVRELLAQSPGLAMAEVDAAMPDGWDDHQLLTVTPRHFDAAVMKTSQVLIEGKYKGVLWPHRHYIPLKADLSNTDEVIENLRDDGRLQELADQTYEDIVISGRYSYQVFAEKLAEALENHLQEGAPAQRESTTPFTNREAVAALERQLAQERQQNALLGYKLDEFRNRIPAVVHEAVVQSAKCTIDQTVRQAIEQTLANAPESQPDEPFRAHNPTLIKWSLMVSVMALLVSTILLLMFLFWNPLR